jgi:hypothetical protein
MGPSDEAHTQMMAHCSAALEMASGKFFVRCADQNEDGQQ